MVFFFFNFLLIIPFFLTILNIWVFFIKNNFYIIKNNLDSCDILKNSKFSKKISFLFLLNWSTPFFAYLFFFLFFFKFDFNNLYFNHIKISNFNLNIVLILILISLVIVFAIKNVNLKNLNFNLDYYFSILNVIIFTLMIFFTNNLFSMIFLLELISLSIFYKFTVSNFYYKNNLFSKHNKKLFDFFLPKHFLNTLFFQYWVNFFSSILLMYFIFNIIYMFGSSEWFFINFISFSTFNKNFLFLFLIFFLGFFLKIGLAPNHLFKIEVYKGLPFLSIFFYTVFYFLSFFLMLVLIMYNYLYSFNKYFILFFYFFTIIGSVFIIFLIFDANFFKKFLAQSTIVNSIFFFFLIISYF